MFDRNYLCVCLLDSHMFESNVCQWIDDAEIDGFAPLITSHLIHAFVWHDNFSSVFFRFVILIYSDKC